MLGAARADQAQSIVTPILYRRAKRPTTLWFNYASDAARRWNDPGLKAKYGFETRLPGAVRPIMAPGLAQWAVISSPESSTMSARKRL